MQPMIQKQALSKRPWARSFSAITSEAAGAASNSDDCQSGVPAGAVRARMMVAALGFGPMTFRL